MTLDQAKTLYRMAVDPDADFNVGIYEWPSIHEEMQQVVAAKSDRAAGKVIQWWDCWDRTDTATKQARLIRKEWKRICETARRAS